MHFICSWHSFHILVSPLPISFFFGHPSLSRDPRPISFSSWPEPRDWAGSHEILPESWYEAAVLVLSQPGPGRSMGKRKVFRQHWPSVAASGLKIKISQVTNFKRKCNIFKGKASKEDMAHHKSSQKIRSFSLQKLHIFGKRLRYLQNIRNF